MSYSSQQPYSAPGLPLAAPAPDMRAASLVSDTMAQGFAQVGAHFTDLWARAEQAKVVNEATTAWAKISQSAVDLQLGFAQDPDPATVPDRFKQAAAEWKQAQLKDLPAPVAAYVARHIDTYMPTLYRQVLTDAHARNVKNLQGAAADAFGANAQAIAAARDEPQLLQHLEALKQGIAGNVRSGVFQQHDAPVLFTRALAQAITIKAATDPIGAQAMLDRFKGEMDAGTVAHLTSSLRAPVERRQDEDDVQRRLTLPQDVRDRAQVIVQGLIDRGLPQHVAQGLAANAVQESGANPDTAPGDGGRSFHLMQWNGPRIAALRAQYGDRPTLAQQLDFVVSELRGSEKAAGDALLATRTPEDAARVASTRYLRPRDTATEERRRAGYATLLAGGNGRQVVMDAVRADAAGLPLARQLHRESLVQQWFNQLEAQQGQERALLGQQLTDLKATYLQGETGAAVPEARIRQLFGPEVGQRHIDELAIARTAGDAIKASAYASEAEQFALRAAIAGNPADPYMAAERRAAVAHFDQARQRIQTALKDDPGGYAATAPEVRQLAAAGATPQQLMAAGVAVQARMGVMPSSRRLLTNDQASQMAELLRTTGPDKADMGATLAGLAKTFGADDPDPARRATGSALFNAALGELVKHQKIGWEWQAFAGMDRPEQAQGRALLQQALKFEAERGGPDALLKAMPEGENKNLRGELDSQLADLRTVTSHHPGGLAMFDSVRRSVETIARMRVIRGETASQAAKNAYNDVIGHKWEPAGDDGSGWIFDTPTMLVPKGQAGRIETALAQVRSAIQPGDIVPLHDPLRPSAQEAELRDATASAARRGFWINNADGSGAVLVGRSAGGAIVNIMRADGRPIEVLFEHLPRTGEALAGAAPQPAADQPGAQAPPRIIDRQRFLRAMSHPSFDPYTTVLDGVVDFLLPQTMPPGVAQGSDMPPSTVTVPDRPAERLPVFRPIPSWSERAQQRYGRRAGMPLEGDR